MNPARRRQVLAIAGMALGPSAALGQAPTRGRPWRIGYLALRARPTAANPDLYYDAFVQGLRERGYVEGKNIVIEWRFAGGKFEVLPALAAELASLNADVLVTHSTPAAQALQRATRTTPIVFTAVGNPVESGLAASLSRPGGNITGQSNMTNDVSVKQLELLRAVLPGVDKVAVLVNPANATGLVIVDNVRTAAERLGMHVLAVSVRDAGEIEKAFAQIVQSQSRAVIVAPDSLFVARRSEIAQRSIANRIVCVSAFREDVVAGGLISYGPVQTEIYRRGASYVDRILKGAKPGELPIEQPTTFELFINATTASILAIQIPAAVSAQADRIVN